MIRILNKVVKAQENQDQIYNKYTYLIKKYNRLIVTKKNLSLENQRLLIKKEEFNNKIYKKEVIIQFLKKENRES